jgi:hypothetical protein
MRLQVTVGAEVAVAPPLHRTVRCHRTCPVNYSGVAVANSRSWRVQSRVIDGGPAPVQRVENPGAPDSPVRQTREPSVVPLLFLLNPFLGLFIGLL